MKSSFLAPLPIMLYTIIILFLQKISFAAADAQNASKLIHMACAQTKARDLCNTVITSDPRSASGDVRVFSIIVLEKALAQSKADDLDGRCPEAYEKLVDDSRDAMENLKAKQLEPLVEDSINNAIKDAADCHQSDERLLTLLNIAKDVLRILN